MANQYEAVRVARYPARRELQLDDVIPEPRLRKHRPLQGERLNTSIPQFSHQQPVQREVYGDIPRGVHLSRLCPELSKHMHELVVVLAEHLYAMVATVSHVHLIVAQNGYPLGVVELARLRPQLPERALEDPREGDLLDAMVAAVRYVHEGRFALRHGNREGQVELAAGVAVATVGALKRVVLAKDPHAEGVGEHNVIVQRHRQAAHVGHLRTKLRLRDDIARLVHGVVVPALEDNQLEHGRSDGNAVYGDHHRMQADAVRHKADRVLTDRHRVVAAVVGYGGGYGPLRPVDRHLQARPLHVAALAESVVRPDGEARLPAHEALREGLPLGREPGRDGLAVDSAHLLRHPLEGPGDVAVGALVDALARLSGPLLSLQHGVGHVVHDPLLLPEKQDGLGRSHGGLEVVHVERELPLGLLQGLVLVPEVPDLLRHGNLRQVDQLLLPSAEGVHDLLERLVHLLGNLVLPRAHDLDHPLHLQDTHVHAVEDDLGLVQDVLAEGGHTLVHGVLQLAHVVPLVAADVAVPAYGEAAPREPAVVLERFAVCVAYGSCEDLEGGSERKDERRNLTVRGEVAGSNG